MEKGILDVVGGEIISLVTPVSICMFLVVSMVHILDPHGEDKPISSIAMMAYNEQASDSFSEKLGGALLNAIVFVLIVTVVTFMLVALFYYRCTRCLKVYMGMSAFTVLAWMGGIVAVQFIRLYSIPVDVVTFLICTINFASVGVAAVFFTRMPILVTQGYLVVIGALVAFWFTKLPEWTTWILLLAMAGYDVVAVLTPRGPLNLLVEMAIERDEEIPALIYEARPNYPSGVQMPPPSSDAQATRVRRWRRNSQASNARPDTELGESSRSASNAHPETTLISSEGDSQILVPAVPEVGILGSRLISPVGEAGSLNAVSTVMHENQVSDSHLDDDTAPLVQRHAQSSASTGISDRVEAGADDRSRRLHGTSQPAEEDNEDPGIGTSGGLKLGLGDFVFYSVLVGRAAMYDLMTVYACYLAIVAGLGATLILLAVWQRALPALPISISFGVLFYFLARLFLDPFVLDMSTSLVFI
ncbi:hypothetical protein M758_4G206100 [Ceratodon purpureus]|nr:hypothetical protein M758_4G206100 [Ceratodon purpureus]KAG0620304.1 hypothetical protein M758_4G206100 [Ceratodon purpureus]KAG0620305.1 hypothetical protein M758_4G206100 [Ceratodon purpureus]